LKNIETYTQEKGTCMILIIAFEVLIVVTLGWTLITQVSIPIIRGTKLFPMFRKEEKLKDELAELKQETIEKNIEKRIKNKKRETSSNPKMSAIADDD
jgi:hypothetical protein